MCHAHFLSITSPRKSIDSSHVVRDQRLWLSASDSFQRASSLCTPLVITHNSIDIIIQTKEFPSWVAFLAWKEEEEALTFSCFVQPKGEVTGSEEKIAGLATKLCSH